ncbi:MULTISPECIES: latrotoxin-related protein [Wolbachia]|uniref:latrotoxin-related protein n=1 Tax=Wolbachia TaxID=953 RepID=UPI001E540B8D|nr:MULTISPECIES: latrotoxin-related protein [unclassified Wolbachia]UFO00747.1 latrotoxin-related protein [Wolbachia endosymbiont of Corcyra cephalonica]
MPRATAEAKHIEHKLELIELLLTEPINPGNSKGNPVLSVNFDAPKGFAEKFSLFLRETPNIGSTSSPEFFIHSILGSILTLPNSGLVEKLGINKVYIKRTNLKVEGLKNEISIVKLCFFLEKSGRKQVVLRAFTNDQITGYGDLKRKYCYNDDELKEIAKTLEISDIDNTDINEYSFHMRTEEDLGNLSFELYREQRDRVKEKFKDLVSSPSQTSEFEEINIGRSTSLEGAFKQLSDKSIDQVIVGIREIFLELAEIYKSNQGKFSLGNSEAAYHGFVYGALALNFKYRYGLNCYVERAAGNGRADLILMSRTKDANGRINPKPVPVVVEFKGEGHTADEAITQIKNKGYLYNLSIRTKAEEAVIVGISYAEVKTEQAKIFQSQGFVHQLLEGAKDFDGNEAKENLKAELKNLYHLIPSKDKNYLSKLVFGQILAMDSIDKNIFTYQNEDRSIGREATTFLLFNQGEDRAVILNIIERSGELRELRRQKRFDSNKIPPIDELDIDSAVKIDLIINTGVKNNLGGFEVGERKDKSYFQDINIKEVSHNSKNRYKGKFERIGNVDVNSLIEQLRGIDVVDLLKESKDEEMMGNKLKESLSPLVEALLPFKELIKREVDFQAIMQGLLINGKTQDGKEIKVYVESNISSLGKMDLALSFTYLQGDESTIEEDEPIIIELKCANSSVKKKLGHAEKQMSDKYKILRSFTDKRTAKFLAMVFNQSSRSDKDLITASIKSIEVYHTTSQGEISSPERGGARKRLRLETGPQMECLEAKRRKIRNIGMYCIDSRDEENITEEEKEQRIKELFNANKVAERVKNIEFYDQLFKVSERISRGEATDQNVEEAFIAKVKNVDLNSIDPEIKDIVKEMKENKEEIKNILRGYGVAEKIGKVAESAGFAFTVFLVGKHIANGDVEGLGYDALNLWVMPKIGEKISGKILGLGEKLDSQMLKGFAPVMGPAIGNFAAFLGLAESIKARESATNPVDIKIADLNIATNSIFIAADVPAIVTETMSAVGIEAGVMGEFAGPVGTAISVAVIIISQFVEAELEVEKLEEHINLTDQEKHDLYWDFFLGKKVPDYIENDIEAESIYKQYVLKLISQYKGNYDKIVMSLPYILVTKEKRVYGEIQLLRVYCRTNTKIVDTKFDFGFNTNVTYPFHISDINSRVIPTNIESYSVVCGPHDSDIKVQIDNPPCTDCVVNGIGSGCDNLYDHSNVLLNRTFEKWFLQEYPSDCYNAVIYRNKNFRGYGSVYYITAQNANINVVFQEKDILNGDRGRRGKVENRYYFEKSLDSCKVYNSGRNFFYIAGKFSCDLGADRQKNIVITQGNLTTDSINIHSIIGSNRTNYIKFSNADYVDGKGGNDIITAKNFATIKGYFGDSIHGSGLVLLPINFSDIDKITHVNDRTNIYNKSGDSISVDKQTLIKTADGLFVTPTKVESNTGTVASLQITKSVGSDVILDDELDKLQTIDNRNFNITKQLSSTNYRSTIGSFSNHIFYPDKEHHNFYWEAPSNINHLYLFDEKSANITIAQANGILDFSQLNSTLNDIQFAENNEGEIKINKSRLNVTLLPDYKDVTVTFDREKYYKLQNGELERDYCSHSLKIDGRFSVNGTDLLNHYNCFTFDSDKVLFLKLNNDLLLLSDKGAYITDYYSFVHRNWDLSIELNNRIIEPEEFGERADDFSSFRYYKPDEQGLQIYHNQPINKNDIGLVDLKGKSILDFDMKVMNDTLLLSHKNNTLVKVENWNTYQPAREMMFAFNDTIVSNSKCIASTCNPQDVIMDFNKEKQKQYSQLIKTSGPEEAKSLIRKAIQENKSNLLEALLDGMRNRDDRYTLINAKNDFGETFLHLAISQCFVDNGVNNLKDTKLKIVELLLNSGIDVNAQDTQGKTSLHRVVLLMGYLVQNNHDFSLLQLLIFKNADVNIRDNNSKKPLDIARDKGFTNIISFLEKAERRNEYVAPKHIRHHKRHAYHRGNRHRYSPIEKTTKARIEGKAIVGKIESMIDEKSPTVGYDDVEVMVIGGIEIAAINRKKIKVNKAEEVRYKKATSRASALSSWINSLFGSVKTSIGRLLDSKPTLSDGVSSTTSPISQVDSPVDINGTIMLLDVLIRKVTGQKYISTADQHVSLLEAQGYALNITEEFEKVVEQAGLKSGVSMHRLNIDFVEIQKEVTGKIMSGKFDEISGIFNSYVEKACSGKEAGKLSPKKFEKFIAQFNKGLLNQSIEQILHNRDGRLEVDGTKKQQISLEPQSYLSNASVHSHSKDKVSTCLSDVGVTKLGNTLSK